MRKEMQEIERILVANGWMLSLPAAEGKMAEYTKAYGNGANVLGIEISLEPCSLSVNERYGISLVQVVKYEAPMPYYRDDLHRMCELITQTENDLVRAGIPFRPNYGFGGLLELNLEKNLELRKKYHLDQFEEEDLMEEESERYTQQYMNDHFDMNGDPYRDFLGNPWRKGSVGTQREDWL